MLRDKEQRKVDSVVYKEEEIYMPKDNKLRIEIIRLYHDILVEGHYQASIQQKRVTFGSLPYITWTQKGG